MLKNLMAAAAAACAMAAGSAHAVNVHPMVSFGITGGGDELARAPTTGGYYDSLSIKAGGLISLAGGLEFQLTDVFSTQVTVGYHFDRANADNGDFRFDRYPVEVLGHYRVVPNVRVGGGLRSAGSAKLRANGAGTWWAQNEDFKAKLGYVVEGEYLFAQDRMGVKLRIVSEKYESKAASRREVDGNHVGAYFTYYFR